MLQQVIENIERDSTWVEIEGDAKERLSRLCLPVIQDIFMLSDHGDVDISSLEARMVSILEQWTRAGAGGETPFTFSEALPLDLCSVAARVDSDLTGPRTSQFSTNPCHTPPDPYDTPSVPCHTPPAPCHTTSAPLRSSSKERLLELITRRTALYGEEFRTLFHEISPHLNKKILETYLEKNTLTRGTQRISNYHQIKPAYHYKIKNIDSFIVAIHQHISFETPEYV
ncbi:MAG: hypothetical protein KBC64_01365 [Simkaniaceae bacterium]|nr:hypothetical protein [Simkaniaceae bacterium]